MTNDEKEAGALARVKDANAYIYSWLLGKSWDAEVSSEDTLDLLEAIMWQQLFSCGLVLTPDSLVDKFSTPSRERVTATDLVIRSAAIIGQIVGDHFENTDAILPLVLFWLRFEDHDDVADFLLEKLADGTFLKEIQAGRISEAKTVVLNPAEKKNLRKSIKKMSDFER